MNLFEEENTGVTVAANSTGMQMETVFAYPGMAVVRADIEHDKLDEPAVNIAALDVEAIFSVIGDGSGESLATMRWAACGQLDSVHVLVITKPFTPANKFRSRPSMNMCGYCE